MTETNKTQRAAGDLKSDSFSTVAKLHEDSADNG